MMIVSDILKVVKEECSKGEGARVTMILRKANLPYNRLTEITERMVKNGLLEVDLQEKGSIYRITPKGEEVLESLIKFEEFAKAFGLRL